MNPGSGGDDSDAAQALETWILLELCTAGSLQVGTHISEQPGSLCLLSWSLHFGDVIQVCDLKSQQSQQPDAVAAAGCRSQSHGFCARHAAACQGSRQQTRGTQHGITASCGFAAQAAIDDGKLRQRAEGGAAAGPPDMARVLTCAVEMASALHYLHGQNINHGERMKVIAMQL